MNHIRSDARRWGLLLAGLLASIPLLYLAVQAAMSIVSAYSCAPNYDALVIGVLVFAGWTVVAVLASIAIALGLLISATRQDKPVDPPHA